MARAHRGFRFRFHGQRSTTAGGHEAVRDTRDGLAREILLVTLCVRLFVRARRIASVKYDLRPRVSKGTE